MSNCIEEENYLQLSGIQHFYFCKRQWALIHVENQWSDNVLTLSGQIIHETAHDKSVKESRRDMFRVRGMGIKSNELGVSGECDVVEFNKSENGVYVAGKSGLWSLFPVEYKHGASKADDCDRVQLCAQAMCLEEMFSCTVDAGALYYAKTHSRENVEITEDLRQETKVALAEMRSYFERGYTPRVKMTKKCESCSLRDICLPKLNKVLTVKTYIERSAEE